MRVCVNVCVDHWVTENVLFVISTFQPRNLECRTQALALLPEISAPLNLCLFYPSDAPHEVDSAELVG